MFAHTRWVERGGHGGGALAYVAAAANIFLHVRDRVRALCAS